MKEMEEDRVYLFCRVYLFPFGDNAASLKIHGVTVRP
jgi:hypothetical protein